MKYSPTSTRKTKSSDDERAPQQPRCLDTTSATCRGWRALFLSACIVARVTASTVTNIFSQRAQHHIRSSNKNNPRCGMQTPGTLILDGGEYDRDRNTATSQAILDHLPVSIEKAELVLIVGGGSELDDDEREEYKDLWGDIGFDTSDGFSILHPESVDSDYTGVEDAEEANDKDFVKPLKSADAVFMRGGRQWRLVDAFKYTRTHEELWNLLERGGVVAGTSAGATSQGWFMPRGDPSGSSILVADREWHQYGFGFLPGVAVDVHVDERDRWEDMYQVLRDKDHRLLGIGISEETAIVVQGNYFQVVGEDASKSIVAVYSCTNKSDCNENDAPYLELKPGDWFDLCDRTIVSEPKSEDLVVMNARSFSLPYAFEEDYRLAAREYRCSGRHCRWVSSLIHTVGYVSLRLTAHLQSDGNVGSEDTLKIYYRYGLDGIFWDWVRIYSESGQVDADLSTEIVGLDHENSVLQIRIESATSNEGGEIYIVRSLSVVGIAAAPTPEPTRESTPQPSSRATSVPTNKPTDMPANMPTNMTTSKPTSEPTPALTATPSSLETSAAPTNTPTPGLTPVTTLAPTPMPTLPPTTPMPTLIPTSIKSETPTINISTQASVAPSIVTTGVSSPQPESSSSTTAPTHIPTPDETTMPALVTHSNIPTSSSPIFDETSAVPTTASGFPSLQPESNNPSSTTNITVSIAPFGVKIVFEEALSVERINLASEELQHIIADYLLVNLADDDFGNDLVLIEFDLTAQLDLTMTLKHTQRNMKKMNASYVYSLSGDAIFSNQSDSNVNSRTFAGFLDDAVRQLFAESSAEVLNFIAENKDSTVLGHVMDVVLNPKPEASDGSEQEPPHQSSNSEDESEQDPAQKSSDNEESPRLAVILGAVSGGIVALLASLFILVKCRGNRTSLNGKTYMSTTAAQSIVSATYEESEPSAVQTRTVAKGCWDGGICVNAPNDEANVDDAYQNKGPV